MNVLLLSILILGVSPDVEVQTLAGEKLTGRLSQLDAESITVETPEGPHTLKTERLAGFEPRDTQPAQKKSGLWVQLVDGSLLSATQYSCQDETARLIANDGKTLTLPTQSIRAVRFQANTPDMAASWSKLIKKQVDADLLVIRKANAIDFHEGVLRNVTESIVEFELDGDLLPVKRTKIQGLIYFRPPKGDLPEPICRITSTDGSFWQVRSLSLEDSTLRWTTLTGLEVSRPLVSTTRVDFSQGKIVYLSDLEPESVRWMPYLGSANTLKALTRFYRPRRDRGMVSKTLQIEGTTYRKGLSIHSRTELVYRLPDSFRRFKALVGIDDRFRPQGDVRLEIRGDKRLLANITIRGTEPAESIDLDLSGVRRLTLLVDYGEKSEVGDHLDLCEARVLK